MNMGPDAKISFWSLKFTKAIYGGIIATIIIFLGGYLVGNLGSFEALANIKEIRPSLRFVCSAILTATSTILALLLTLLSFSGSTEKNIRAEHFMRIQWIARFACFTFAAAICLLLFLNLPIENADDKLADYYVALYYIFLSYGAIMGGLMISIVLMLYQAASEIILLVHPNKEEDYILVSEQSGEHKEQPSS